MFRNIHWQIITIILNLQLVNMSKLRSKLSRVTRTIFPRVKKTNNKIISIINNTLKKKSGKLNQLNSWLEELLVFCLNYANI